MNKSNLQLIHEGYAAFARKDIPAVLETLAPDATWGMVGREQDVPMAGVRQGPEGVVSFFRTMAETVEILSFEPLEFQAAEDKVFVSGRWRWIMRKNGVPGENEWLHVFTLREGKLVSWRGYNDTAQLALAWRGISAAPEKRAVNR